MTCPPSYIIILKGEGVEQCAVAIVDAGAPGVELVTIKGRSVSGEECAAVAKGDMRGETTAPAAVTKEAEGEVDCDAVCAAAAVTVLHADDAGSDSVHTAATNADAKEPEAAPLSWKALLLAKLPPSEYSPGSVAWLFDVVYSPMMLAPSVTLPPGLFGWREGLKAWLRRGAAGAEEDGGDGCPHGEERALVDVATKAASSEGASAFAPAAKSTGAGSARRSVHPPHVVQLKLLSILSILVLGTYAVVSSWYAFQLTTPEEEEEWFANGHMFNGLRDRRAKNFFSATNTDNTGVNVNWGIKGIDRNVNPSGGTFNRWIPGQDRGTVVWDDSFSLATPAAQQWVLDTCALLESQPCSAVGCSLGKLVLPNSLVCPLAVLKTWLDTSFTKSGLCETVADGGMCYSRDPGAFFSVTRTRAGVAPRPSLPSSDAAMSAAFVEFLELNPNSAVAKQKLAGIVGGKLRFMTLSPYSTMPLLASQVRAPRASLATQCRYLRFKCRSRRCCTHEYVRLTPSLAFRACSLLPRFPVPFPLFCPAMSRRTN